MSGSFQDAQRKQERQPKHPPAPALALSGQETDQQRNAREVARAQQDTDDAPKKRAEQSDQKRLRERPAQISQQFFQHAALFLQTPGPQQALDLGEWIKAFVAVKLTPFLVKENLGGDDSDAVCFCRGVILPYVIEHDSDLIAEPFFQVAHDRLHRPAGNAIDRTEFDKGHQGFRSSGRN